MFMFKKTILAFLLIVSTAINAQAFEFVGVNVGAGYAFGSSIGGSSAGNLDKTRYVLIEPEASFHLLEINSEADVVGNVGLQLLSFESPDEGFGSFVFTNLRLVLKSFEDQKIKPYLLAGVGAGGVDINSAWDEQADGGNFILQAGYGINLPLGLGIEYRFHHISNASLNAPNKGPNTNIILINFDIYSILF
jgi:hypothetical protein